MANEVLWGLLSKFLDDDETIEEAIARLITAHNDDPDSHDSTDQSLADHRLGSPLDHPTGSVVGDKFNNTDLLFWDWFTALTGWTLTGLAATGGFGKVTIPAIPPASTTSAITWGVAEAIPFSDPARLPYFQATCKMTQVVNGVSYLGPLSFSGTSPAKGFGFFNDKGTLKGIALNAGSVTSVTLTGNPTLSGTHVYRCECPFGEDLDFYVDGVLLGTITGIDALDIIQNNIDLRSIAPAGTDRATLTVLNVFFGCKPL